MDSIYIVFEDQLSESVMRQLIRFCSIKVESIIPINSRGSGNIRKKISSYNQADESLYFFVLTDLDTSECAPKLIQDLLTVPFRRNLLFRVAVREVEAWLLADSAGLSNFLHLNQAFIEKETGNPEKLNKPKETLIKIIDRSKIKSIKEDIVGDQMNQGPAYNSKLKLFVENEWDIDRAMKRSDSLNRAVIALRKWDISR